MLASTSLQLIISHSHLTPLTPQRSYVGRAGLLPRRKQEVLASVMEGINWLHRNGRKDLKENSHPASENREQKPLGNVYSLTQSPHQQSPPVQRVWSAYAQPAERMQQQRRVTILPQGLSAATKPESDSFSWSALTPAPCRPPSMGRHSRLCTGGLDGHPAQPSPSAAAPSGSTACGSGHRRNRQH